MDQVLLSRRAIFGDGESKMCAQLIRAQIALAEILTLRPEMQDHNEAEVVLR